MTDIYQGIHSKSLKKGVFSLSSILSTIEKALKNTDQKLQRYPYIRAVVLAIANNFVLGAAAGTVAALIAATILASP